MTEAAPVVVSITISLRRTMNLNFLRQLFAPQPSVEEVLAAQGEPQGQALPRTGMFGFLGAQPRRRFGRGIPVMDEPQFLTPGLDPWVSRQSAPRSNI